MKGFRRIAPTASLSPLPPAIGPDTHLDDCTLAPIPARAKRVDDALMVQMSIRSHPCVPVAAQQLEQWVNERVADLRGEVPQGTIRLSRLMQHLPESDLAIGWLLELELFEADFGRLEPRIADAVRDMRLLGLQPTVMAPVKSGPLTLGEPLRANGDLDPSRERRPAAMVQ
jgi:hypothetical protein